MKVHLKWQVNSSEILLCHLWKWQYNFRKKQSNTGKPNWIEARRSLCCFAMLPLWCQKKNKSRESLGEGEHEAESRMRWINAKTSRWGHNKKKKKNVKEKFKPKQHETNKCLYIYNGYYTNSQIKPWVKSQLILLERLTFCCFCICTCMTQCKDYHSPLCSQPHPLLLHDTVSDTSSLKKKKKIGKQWGKTTE